MKTTAMQTPDAPPEAPGSPCSIHFTLSDTPGSARGIFLVVSDVEAARAELIRNGAAVGEVFHYAAGPVRSVGRYPAPRPTA
jgi:hypothetical protein